MIAYVINPGSTSTKLALARISPSPNPDLPGNIQVALERREVFHPDLVGDLHEQFARIHAELMQGLEGWPAPDAVAGRGGLIGPASAGTYVVTDELAQFALASPYGQHASNMGAALALEVATRYGVPAFIVDPPTVDELLPEARVSGFPGIERRSRFHALNTRAVGRRAAYEVGKRFSEAVVVVAHLGGGNSVTTFLNGRAVDTTGALLDEGPFSPQRAGTLPTSGLLDLAYRFPRPELERLLTQEGGFRGLLGTADLRELERRERDEATVRAIVEAYIHQVVKAVGAYSVVAGRPDAIALTGGAARWPSLIDRIESRLAWIAPVVTYPGELELEALAEGVGRVLLGHEQARNWVRPGA
ncbi:butyrate kinase [Deinobacterium chartae]|uniref:Probable butyrate kinase n=1 Tax=Deinobacterium chartae TaxID=521158 RepID=A0A841HZK9_9DEIO|nr:butyrate kinase [Deinobacterium chartae]MBB6097322.1 butyrate kinase [Deinobacterium chartae]